MFQAAISVGSFKCLGTSQEPGFQIFDVSNYDDNTTNGHELANFIGFAALFITFPDSSQWVMATTNAVAEPDVVIDVPYSGNVIVTTVPPSIINQNGTYSFSLVVIPDHSLGTEYNQGILVHSGGLIYQAVINQPGTNLLNTAHWLPVTLNSILGSPESYSAYIAQTTSPVQCDFVPSVPFQASLLDQNNLLDISIDGNCDIVTIVDHSNYDTNTEAGHFLANFTGYRRVKISFPTSGEYLLSTPIPDVEFDSEILPASSGEMQIQWDMPDEVKDGRFEVCFCSVPQWNSSSYFPTSTASLPVIVYHNGLLWKSLADTIDSEPSEESEDWEIFDGDLCETRYCFNANFVVTCRVIDKCYKDAVIKANCGQIDCCDDDLCKNPHLLKATGLMLIKAEIPWAVARKDWNRVDSLINAALNKCSC
jgi:hypothetical protein